MGAVHCPRRRRRRRREITPAPRGLPPHISFPICHCQSPCAAGKAGRRGGGLQASGSAPVPTGRQLPRHAGRLKPEALGEFPPHSLSTRVHPAHQLLDWPLAEGRPPQKGSPCTPSRLPVASNDLPKCAAWSVLACWRASSWPQVGAPLGALLPTALNEPGQPLTLPACLPCTLPGGVAFVSAAVSAGRRGGAAAAPPRGAAPPPTRAAAPPAPCRAGCRWAAPRPWPPSTPPWRSTPTRFRCWPSCPTPTAPGCASAPRMRACCEWLPRRAAVFGAAAAGACMPGAAWTPRGLHPARAPPAGPAAQCCSTNPFAAPPAQRPHRLQLCAGSCLPAALACLSRAGRLAGLCWLPGCWEAGGHQAGCLCRQGAARPAAACSAAARCRLRARLRRPRCLLCRAECGVGLGRRGGRQCRRDQAGPAPHLECPVSRLLLAFFCGGALAGGLAVPASLLVTQGMLAGAACNASPSSACLPARSWLAYRNEDNGGKLG